MNIFSAFVCLYNLFHWKAFSLRKIILCQQSIQWLPRGHRVDDSFGSWTIVLPLGGRPQQTPVSVFSSRCFCSLSRRIDRYGILCNNLLHFLLPFYCNSCVASKRKIKCVLQYIIDYNNWIIKILYQKTVKTSFFHTSIFISFINFDIVDHKLNFLFMILDLGTAEVMAVFVNYN